MSYLYNNKKEDVETKYLFVSSSNRNIGNNSRFTVYLPNNIVGNNHNNTKNLSISLYNLNLVYEWYNIQSGKNNEFEFDGTKIYIPEGNYSVYQFRDYLNTVINSKYAVSYDLISNKYTFISTDPTATLKATTSGQFFGFENNVLQTGNCSSTYIVNMQLYTSIYLNTDLLSSEYSLDNISQKKVNSSTILDIIPINAAPYDTITYNSMNSTSMDITVNNSLLSSIEFYLTTDNGDALDNLRYPWTITLKLLINTQEV